MLSAAGDHVTAVGTADEARRQLAATEPLGLLVAELTLPDGDRLVGEARATRPGLVTVVLAGAGV